MTFLRSNSILIVALLILCKICTGQGPLTDSLIAYYPFNSNALDESGNGNDGTVSGASLVADRFGNTNSAYYFNGNGDYISLNATSNFKPTTFPVSVCCWIKSNSSQYTTGLFLNDFTADVYTGIIFEVNPGNGGVLAINYGDGGPNSSGYRRSKLGTVFINDDQWHFVAAVIRGATDMDLYIDCDYDPGSYSGTGGPMAYSNNDGRFGMRDESSGNYYYQGVIDDLRFYHRELTQSDLQLLYYTPVPFGNLGATVSLGNDVAICDSGFLILDPTVSAPVQSYLWSNGSTDSTLIVDQEGQYWVQVFDGCGFSSDTLNITEGSIVPVNLGADTVLCEGQFLVIDASNSYDSYLWSNGANTQSIIINSPGIYYVIVTSNNCSSTDSINVTYTNCTGLNEIIKSSSSAYYDASENSMIIDFGSDLIGDNSVIKLYDTNGQLLRQYFLEATNSTEKINLDWLNASGVFFVSISNRNVADHFAFVKVK